MYSLASYAHVCRVIDGAIVLDLRHHRYFGIPEISAKELGHFIADWPLRTDASGTEPTESVHAGLEALINKGLLTEDRTRLSASKPITVELHASVDYIQLIRRPPRLRPRHVCAFLWSLLSVSLQLRVSTLERIAQRITFKTRNDRSALSAVSEDELCDLLMLFRNMVALTYTARDHCLFDSLVLFHFLRRFGVRATWVIGVRSRPFLAHSWVQSVGLVLNDTISHAQDFIPILALQKG
jgi:hypothetical protein